MNKKLRVVPAFGNTVLSVVLISNLLLHSACSIDDKDFQYCGWYDTERCPDNIDSNYWKCLEDVFDCAYGKLYHCARHYTNKSMIIHACAESKECLPGEAPYLDNIKDGEPTNELHVTCAECHDKEHFNDMKKNSSTYSECKQKTKCDPEHGIECNPVNINSKDVYKMNRECRCNTFENYVFSHSSNSLVCTSDEHIAKECYNVGPCRNGMERVQNRTCVPKCIRGHRTKYSDECIEDPETTTSSQNPQSKHSTAKILYTSQSTSQSQTVIPTDLSSVIQSSTTDKPDPNTNNWKVAFIITAVTAVILAITVFDGRRQLPTDTQEAPALELEPLQNRREIRCQAEIPDMDRSDEIKEKTLQSKTDEQDVLHVVRKESELPLSNSNGSSKQTASPDQGLAVLGQTVVYHIQGDYYDLKENKNVKLSRYGNGNHTKEKTKDKYQKVGSEQTTIQENQLTENKNEISKVSDVERELGGAQLNDKSEVAKENEENSDESSTEDSSRLLTDIRQTYQALYDKLADQSNPESDATNYIRSTEGESKESSTTIRDTTPFEDFRNAVNSLNICTWWQEHLPMVYMSQSFFKMRPVSFLNTLSSKSPNFEGFLMEVNLIDASELYRRPLQLYQEINNNPSISQEFYESDQKKYCPDGFLRLTSTGDGNCLFNSISILLFGNEYFALYLRLVASIVAAKNWETFLKDALANNTSGESEADITDKVHKDIMSTALNKEYMDRPHVQFLSIAIKRRIVQYHQNKRLVEAITGDPNQDKDTIDPIFSERDSNKDLHILWVNSDGDTSRSEDHIVPLLIKGNFSR